MATLLPIMSEEEKKQIKVLEPIILDLCAIDSIAFASTMSIESDMQSKCILKLKEPSQFIQKLKVLIKQLSTAELNGTLNQSVVKDSFSYSLSDDQKINELQVYKLSNLRKEQKYEPVHDSSLFEIMTNTTFLPKEHFIVANKDYCFIANSFEKLKELIVATNSDAQQKVKAESFNYFKSGASFYTDTYLDGYIKLFELMLKIKLDKFLGLKLPSFKTSIKLDGNFTIRTFVETETIATIIQKIQEYNNP
jgi:hypothetical protein